MKRFCQNNISKVFILLFILSTSFCKAQQHKFDSLKLLLIKTKNPEKRAKLLIDIAKSIYYSIPDSSIGYCEQAEEISKKNNLEVQLAYSLNCECRYLLLKGDIKTSIEKINQSITLFEKHNELNGLAKAYSQKSIALGKLNNSTEKIVYLYKAKDIYSKLNDKPGIVSVLSNLANTYISHNQYSLALKALDECALLNLPKSGDEFFVELNYGNVFFGLDDQEKAISHYKKAIEVAHQFKMLDSEITGLTNLAESYLKQKNISESKNTYLKALQLAKENNLMVEESDALKGMTDLFELEEDYKNAFLSLKKYKTIQDSILNVEKVKSINNIEHKLQLTEKEKIITQQSLSLEKEKVALASSKNNALLLIAGLIIAGIGFVFLFYYNRKTKKLFSLIQLQKIEVEKQKEIIELKNKDVMDSIHYAKYIQGSMLPSSKTMNSLFSENFILYKPKDVVAGDFYWTEKIDNKAAIAVCDCTGHGVPGAMVSIVACNALNRAVKEFKLSNPALIFDKVNELMQETFSKSDYEVRDGMDASLCLLDYDTMQIHIACANNPIWIVSQPKNNSNITNEPWQLAQINADKKPIGRFNDESAPFTLKTISVQKGDIVYLFSDGYADQFGGPKGKKFKYKQLQDLLISLANLPLSEQNNFLNKTITNWQGNLEQVDDILIIGIKI